MAISGYPPISVGFECVSYLSAFRAIHEMWQIRFLYNIHQELLFVGFRSIHLYHTFTVALTLCPFPSSFTGNLRLSVLRTQSVVDGCHGYELRSLHRCVCSRPSIPIFLFRILRQIVEIGYKESLLPCTFFFSFAYIMVTVVAPDHFGLSLFFLLLTLYIAGRCIKCNKKMPSWVTALLFLLSTGITTTNCVKIGLAQWFANGRRVFHLRSFLIAFILPSCLLVGSYLLIDEYIQKPEQERRDNSLQERLKDPKFKKELEAFHKKQDKAHANAIMSGETFRWTDMKLSRSRSIVENLFGESLMFHDEKMLHDVNVDRPVFVAYTNYFCYVIVGIVLLLFILGIACGIKSHFFLLCLSWFGFDMFLHLVLGFGLQEVYIMTAHWAFIIPIAIAYTFKYFKNVEYQQTLKYIVLFLTIFLVTYNWNLYIHYMLS